jgi:hypothetical protein
MSCLLVLARAQHGALPCRGVLALDCVVSAALAAREDAIIAGNLTVQHVIGDGIWVEGSQPLLRRMADNVIGNNQAERTIRPVIIQQRSSGGSWRTLDGLADFAIVESYLSTAVKWGISKLDALRGLFNGHA